MSDASARRYLEQTFPFPIDEFFRPDRVNIIKNALPFLTYIYGNADRRTGTGTVCLADYSRRAGISYSTVKRHKERLERAGVAHFEAVRGEDGRTPLLAYTLPQYPTEDPDSYDRAVVTYEDVDMGPAFGGVQMREVIRIDGRVVRS